MSKDKRCEVLRRLSLVFCRLSVVRCPSKTRTVLVCEFAVFVYRDVWKTNFQLVNKLLHSLALFGCPGVFGLAVHVQTSYVADAYAVGVVAVGVSTRHFQWSAYLHSAVEQYHIVVAYHLKALSAMPLIYIFGRKVLTFLCGRAMKYNFVYFSHGVFF